MEGIHNIFKSIRLLGKTKLINASFSTSRPCNHIGNWRKQRGLEFQHTEHGPLTNRPDYSFVDGRPVPIASNIRRRMEKQLEYTTRIVKLSKEIDFAVERHAANMKKNEISRNTIIGNKLKPKGAFTG